MKNKFSAFTLAEVLVALSIIGVVAALTIPATIKDYRRHQVEVALKKNYNVLTQALIKAQVEYGSMNGWSEFQQDNLQKHEYGGLSVFTTKYLMPYLNVVSHKKDKYLNFGYEKGADVFRLATDGYMLKLADGTIYVIPTDVTVTGVKTGSNWDYKYARDIDIIIDVNGYKKPNKLGKDIFYFQYPIDGKNIEAYGETTIDYNKSIDDYITKMGWDPSDSDVRLRASQNMTRVSRILKPTEALKDSCYSDASGKYYCAAYIRRNGWKIPRDYPWL